MEFGLQDVYRGVFVGSMPEESGRKKQEWTEGKSSAAVWS